VALTLHRYLKYYCHRKKKINSDVRPFTKAKSYSDDVRFFEEDAILKENMPIVISATEKRGLGSKCCSESCIAIV